VSRSLPLSIKSAANSRKLYDRLDSRLERTGESSTTPPRSGLVAETWKPAALLVTDERRPLLFLKGCLAKTHPLR